MAKSPWFAPTEQFQGQRTVHKRVPLTLVGLIGLFLLAFAIAAFVPLQEHPRAVSNGDVVMPATLSEVVAGCAGLVFTPVQVPSEQLGSDSKFEYSHLPPSSGDWSLPAAKPGIYPVGAQNMPLVSQVVAALREGRVVIWYNPMISQARFAALTGIVTGSPYRDRLTVLPWNVDDTEVGAWEKNRTITYTSWGTRLNCDVASDQVLASFIDQAMRNPFARDERVIAGFNPHLAVSQ